ncbi:MAG: hypothetical protein ACK5TN_15720, partial [Acidobacteriota bacterium]
MAELLGVRKTQKMTYPAGRAIVCFHQFTRRGFPSRVPLFFVLVGNCQRSGSGRSAAQGKVRLSEHGLN